MSYTTLTIGRAYNPALHADPGRSALIRAQLLPLKVFPNLSCGARRPWDGDRQVVTLPYLSAIWNNGSSGF